ncbi:MAG: hypothetical protein GY750_01880 [Lentisphaerae bacterium]|nr:hypothetical protein [Lentisphaerota bacterium]MCP4100170.1 hypothetical protein [Lentisphaerota bacterium]
MKNKLSLLIPFCMAMLLSTGCNTIRHKAFRVVTSGTGGKFASTDPTGSGNPTPTVIIGSYFSSLNTIPPGTIAHYKAKSYELFSRRLLFEEEMRVDTTHDTVKVSKNKIEYEKN